jgi:hypothetical protein
MDMMARLVRQTFVVDNTQGALGFTRLLIVD